jgi:hypothetical protein
LGGPWFENKKECDFASLWLKEYETFLTNHALEFVA